MGRTRRPLPKPDLVARPTMGSRIVRRRPDRLVWEAALGLASGDVRRLEVEEDGAVVVRNRRVR